MTKEQIEDESRLIQACTRCGAKYQKPYIVMPDGTKHRITSMGNAWGIEYAPKSVRTFLKEESVLELQIHILRAHTYHLEYSLPY